MLELPVDNTEATKAMMHVNAYADGYLFEKVHDQSFENGMSGSKILHPDMKIVQATLLDVWKKHQYPVDQVITFCFNRAGLEDRAWKKESGKHGEWMKCLHELSLKPVMCMDQQILSNGATLCAVQALAPLGGDSAIFLCNEEIKNAVKSRYDM